VSREFFFRPDVASTDVLSIRAAAAHLRFCLDRVAEALTGSMQGGGGDEVSPKQTSQRSQQRSRRRVLINSPANCGRANCAAAKNMIAICESKRCHTRRKPTRASPCFLTEP